MNKPTFNNAILLALLFAAILVFADNSFRPSLSKRTTSTTQTTDACECACDPIDNALKACSNSTDLTCGCDAWINSGPSCSACVAIVETNPGNTFNNLTTRFSNAIFGIQIARALCLCPDACATVTNATYNCGFSSSGTDCTCAVYERDGPTCSACIKSFDQYAGLIMDNFIASCTTGADFRNCTPLFINS